MAKLAAALLRRKELQQKVEQLKGIKAADIFAHRVKRVNVSDSIDEVTADVPKLSASQVTEEYDFYAKRLRLLDGVIQQANWTTDVDSSIDGSDLFQDYTPSGD